MILQAITWNVDPEIFRIGSFAVRWYGLLFASAFFFGYLVFNKFFKIEKIPIEVLDKLTVYMAVGTIIGARLGHCLFYEPEYYLANPLEILKVWQGGLASHGAAIGILISLYMFSRKVQRPYIWILDRIVIVVALGGMFIRLGNLMNSEIYGIETSLPWGFIFVRNHEILPKHPTQLYEALACLVIFMILYFNYLRLGGNIKPGKTFSLFLIMLFTSRFLIEYIKEDQVAFESAMSINMGQWLSIPFILAGIVMLFVTFPEVSKNNPGKAHGNK